MSSLTLETVVDRNHETSHDTPLIGLHRSANVNDVDLNCSQFTALQICCRGSIVKKVALHTAAEAISNNTGIYGSICFVVRRPGCGLSREDGLALSILASLPERPFKGFGVFGVVKETGVDDSGLVKFYSDFFPFSIYRDDDMALYRIFGFRKLKLRVRNPFSKGCNSPFSFLSGCKNVVTRLKRKNIPSNFKGEGLVQGGVLFFGPDGKVAYALEEQTGKEICIEDVLEIVARMKETSESRGVLSALVTKVTAGAA